MIPIIIDSSALFALISTDDALHKKALEVSAQLTASSSLIIPTDVISETINIIGKKLGKEKQLEILEYALENNIFSLHQNTPHTYSLAKKFIISQPKAVSFTDCIVMATADEYETKFIFGFDEIFAKNGYSLPNQGQ